MSVDSDQKNVFIKNDRLSDFSLFLIMLGVNIIVSLEVTGYILLISCKTQPCEYENFGVFMIVINGTAIFVCFAFMLTFFVMGIGRCCDIIYGRIITDIAEKQLSLQNIATD